MSKHRILTGVLLFVMTASLWFSVVPKAQAVSIGATFLDAAHWQVNSLSYSAGDVGSILDRGMVERIGDGDAGVGLTRINSYLAQQAIGIYFDRQVMDDEQEWVMVGSAAASCGNSTMRYQEDSYQIVTLWLNFPNVGCIDVASDSGSDDLPLNTSHVGGAGRTLFAFIDADTIVRVDGQGGNFDLTDPTGFPNTYFSDSEGYVRMVSGTAGDYFEDGESSRGQFGVIPYDANNPWAAPGGVGGGSGTGAGGNNPATPTTCANAEGIGGFALRWLLCPVIELLDAAVNWLDSQLQTLLIVRDPTGNDLALDTPLGSEATDNQFHEAWGRIRNIALAILVPIMLVMVIGTALGVQALDAYTVRRAMPRFLVAILFISTSWYLTGFMITVTNIMGTGIRGLMTQPFGGGASLSELISLAGAGTTTYVGLVIFGGLVLSGTGFMIILSYAFVALIALLIGWLVLTIRQLLLIALVLIAPLAILSWIFPGKDRLWKLWWGTFTRLLIMFPLIMLLVGAGEVFARIISSIP